MGYPLPRVCEQTDACVGGNDKVLSVCGKAGYSSKKATSVGTNFLENVVVFGSVKLEELRQTTQIESTLLTLIAYLKSQKVHVITMVSFPGA